MNFKPDKPENFKLHIASNKVVILAWQVPSDGINPDNQIRYYKIFRDENLIAGIDNIATTFIDSTLNNVPNHRYNISAVNYFFKESERTFPISTNN